MRFPKNSTLLTAALSLVIGVATSASAKAQSLVDYEVRNAQTTRATCSSASGVCSMTLPAVAIGKKFLVKQVSAQITTAAGAVLQTTGAPTFTAVLENSVTSHSFTTLNPVGYVPVPSTPINNGQQLIYVVNEPVLAVIFGGDSLALTFTSSSSSQAFSVDLTVTGVVITL